MSQSVTKCHMLLNPWFKTTFTFYVWISLRTPPLTHRSLANSADAHLHYPVAVVCDEGDWVRRIFDHQRQPSHICECMCACACVHVRERENLCMRVRVRARARVLVRALVRVRMRMRVRASACVCRCVCVHGHVHAMQI